jgi:monoamine oxidase
MGRSPPLTRRRALAASLALPWLGACAPEPAAALPPARWVGASADRGHRLREDAAPRERIARRADVLIVGGGIAGLGAARALRQAGIDDIALLELEDEAGGNSRGHTMAGMACPLGAHYLPLPGSHAHEVIELLHEFGLRRVEGSRVVVDERHLCHAPQERLFIDGAWHEGLLPPVEALPAAERAPMRAHTERFAQRVRELSAGEAFRLPTAHAPWNAKLAALDATSFAAWLDAEGLTASALRWYLDYACRDDYGADAAMVSAWAGLHYFASRHGFAAPGEEHAAEGVFTWPEGNAHLARRLAAPLGARLHTGRIVRRIAAGRDGVTVDADAAGDAPAERWTARQVVVALPLFVAARVVEAPPAALVPAVAAMAWAPWLVANLHVTAAPHARPGLAAAWDSVCYGTADLGYVDAMHQSLRQAPGPTVWTAYRALGGASPAQSREARRALQGDPAEAWARRVFDGLAPMHPDLPRRVERIDLMRYGHAMGIPLPGLRGNRALAALAQPQGRLHFGHADLAGYSVFEEALFHGMRAGREAAAALRAGGAGAPPRRAAG